MKKKFKVVLKFQQPLFSTGEPMVLAYNEGRNIMAQMSLTEEEVNFIFPNDEEKTYWLVEGEVVRGNFEITDFIEQTEEDW